MKRVRNSWRERSWSPRVKLIVATPAPVSRETEGSTFRSDASRETVPGTQWAFHSSSSRKTGSRL